MNDDGIDGHGQPGGEHADDAARAGVAAVAARVGEGHSPAGRGSMSAEVSDDELLLGQLTIYYSDRDVELIVDGETAARALAVFAGHVPLRGAQDIVEPGASDMARLWATYSLDGVRAMVWVPVLPTGLPSTMTIDPPAPARG